MLDSKSIIRTKGLMPSAVASARKPICSKTSARRMTSTIHARSVLDTPDHHVDPNLDAWFIIASAPDHRSSGGVSNELPPSIRLN